MEASKILFRCSGLGNIMADGNTITDKQLAMLADLEAKKATGKITDKQLSELDRLIEKRDSPELAEGVKTHLIDIFASHKYGRREEVKNKYLDKGNEREEDSITLVSRTMKIFFEKNKTRLQNNFIQGEPDLFLGNSIDTAEHTLDTKTSWSLHTFLRSKYKKLDADYFWQGQGYMDLTGAKTHTVAFCLVNGTAEAIMTEKNSCYKNEDSTSQEMKKRLKQIEINHIFDISSFRAEYPGFSFDNNADKWEWDIPMEERIFTVKFERDEAAIRKMHDHVLQCREWMELNLFNNTAIEEVIS